ncbi:MAG TPA: hypothetical protein VM243_13330 [Phycisphaerae bacterium]|nr:hypothetical protein [Phycisphaerae bacterium]
MRVSSLHAVDALGGLIVAGLLSVGVWYGLPDATGASERIPELKAQVEDLDDNLVEMRSALDGQRAEHRRLESEFGDRDLLPEGAPIERDLKAISDLTKVNNLELIQFTPVGVERYPGVKELRYRLTANGSFNDYVRFLRDFEASSSWADITYLKLDSPDARAGDGKPGEFTVSLYSAIREEDAETTTP